MQLHKALVIKMMKEKKQAAEKNDEKKIKKQNWEKWHII